MFEGLCAWSEELLRFLASVSVESSHCLVPMMVPAVTGHAQVKCIVYGLGGLTDNNFSCNAEFAEGVAEQIWCSFTSTTGQHRHRCAVNGSFYSTVHLEAERGKGAAHVMLRGDVRRGC
jgi:hypothetical protein